MNTPMMSSHWRNPFRIEPPMCKGLVSPPWEERGPSVHHHDFFADAEPVLLPAADQATWRRVARKRPL
jgi:hypothetical protein